MRKLRHQGFTLVEILIVVVILGILAAIVVPQFTNASQEAVKGALASQLQTINAQVELYRVQHTGNLPHTHSVGTDGADDEGDALLSAQHNGWGVLVENDYLKDEPRNGYTRSTAIADAWVGVPDTDGSAAGWAYNEDTGEVFANGYDHDKNLLANEADYEDPEPFGDDGGN